ncbi:MAG: tyrosine--tRNA ligase, partial [Betaproteobacteria bacterium]|nr:tyrosine--tRNA ligase [Betaproteobacteria bacterium]
LQKEYGQEPQCILTMPLLEGLDGVDKMSKSKGNYIGIQEAPASMYAKLLSINDTLMWRYFELLSFRPLEEIERLRAEVESGRNPKDAKVLLAREIVTRFHDAAAADAAQADFELRARGGVPEDIAEMRLSLPEGGLALPAALKQAGLVPSTAEALRMLEQRGVRVDGTVAEDRNLRLQAGTYVLQVGKRKFARVVLGA